MRISGLLFSLLASLIISASMLGCKKDREDVKPVCKIASLTSGTSGIGITYDEQGRIKTMVSTVIKRYSYDGNTMTIATEEAGVIQNTMIVVTNSFGLATSVANKDKDGQVFSTIVYEYDGTELRNATFSSPGQPASVSQFTWSNGNLVSITSGSSLLEFGYSDLPAQPGDSWSSINLQMGYEIYRTKNAVSSIQSGTSINLVNYTIDNEGRIGSVVSVGNGTVSRIDFQYICSRP